MSTQATPTDVHISSAENHALPRPADLSVTAADFGATHAVWCAWCARAARWTASAKQQRALAQVGVAWLSSPGLEGELYVPLCRGCKGAIARGEAFRFDGPAGVLVHHECWIGCRKRRRLRAVTHPALGGGAWFEAGCRPATRQTLPRAPNKNQTATEKTAMVLW